MTQFVENLMSRASKLSKTIALAEGTDVRAAKAAEILTQKNVCKVVLIGNEEEIKTKFPEIDFTTIPRQASTEQSMQTLFTNFAKQKA